MVLAMGQSVFLYEAMGLSIRHLTSRFGVFFYESTRPRSEIILLHDSSNLLSNLGKYYLIMKSVVL